MDRRSEFPALDARKSDLQLQHNEAQKQLNDAVYQGKHDPAVEHWIARIREELDELTYVLKVVGHSRIDVTGSTAAIAIFLYAIVMLITMVVFLRLAGV